MPHHPLAGLGFMLIGLAIFLAFAIAFANRRA